jgi:hypothetical protein
LFTSIPAFGGGSRAGIKIGEFTAKRLPGGAKDVQAAAVL